MRLLFSLIFVLSASALSGQSMDTAMMYTSDSSQLSLFELVDVKPNIDPKLWKTLLVDSFQPAIEDAAVKGMRKGVYTVKVQFIVEIDGTISDIKALSDPGYDLAKRAENVLKASPNWNPAEKKEVKVRSFHIQPFTFVIQEQ